MGGKFIGRIEQNPRKRRRDKRAERTKETEAWDVSATNSWPVLPTLGTTFRPVQNSNLAAGNKGRPAWDLNILECIFDLKYSDAPLWVEKCKNKSKSTKYNLKKFSTLSKKPVKKFDLRFVRKLQFYFAPSELLGQNFS